MTQVAGGVFMKGLSSLRGMRQTVAFVAISGGNLALAPGAQAAGVSPDTGISLVTAISLAVVSAAVLSVFFHRLKQPAILAYIAAGLLFQATLSDALGESIHVMEEVSHLGLVFLLFIIGIEMDLGGIRQLDKRGAVAVVLQAPLAVVLILFLQWGAAELGFAIPGLGKVSEAWFFYATVVALSSTAVVVKLLSDKFELTTQSGRVSILTLIAQDIWAVIALTYATMTMAEDAAKAGGGGVMVMVAGGMAVIAFILTMSKWVLPRLMVWLSRSPDMLSLVAIGWCFLCAAAMARIGFSAEMGALLAGLIVRRMPIHSEILPKVLSLRDFFMALFFVALGASLPPPTTAMIFAALPLVLWVILARLLFFTPILMAAGMGTVVSLAASVNLAQISEFSLLLVPIGAAAGALSDTDVGVISYAMMLSVLLSTYGIKFNHDIGLWMNRLPGLRSLSGSSAQGQAAAHDHGAPEVVLLGYHHNAEALAKLMAEKCQELLPKVLVVDFNLKNHARIRAAGMRVRYGDISNPETLRHCGIDKAKVVVLTLSSTFLKGTSSQKIINVLRNINPDMRFIGTASTARNLENIMGEGAWACISPEQEAAPAYLQAIRSALVARPSARAA
jgi:Kef-type K+ transport system membrane component KefB